MQKSAAAIMVMNNIRERFFLFLLGLFISIILYEVYSSMIVPIINDNIEWQFSNYMDDQFNFVNHPELNSLNLRSSNVSLILNTFRSIINFKGINVYEPVGGILKAIFIDIVGLNSRYLRLLSSCIHIVNSFVLLPIWIRLVLSNSIDTKEFNLNEFSLNYILVIISISALYCIHPLNIEVIGWLSAQSYIPALSLTLLSSICFEQGFASSQLAFGFFSVFFYIMATLTKGPAIVLPIVFLLRIMILFFKEKSSFQHHRVTWSIATLIGSFLALLLLLKLLLHSNNESIPDINATFYLQSEDTFLSNWIVKVIKALSIISDFIKRLFLPFDLRGMYVSPTNNVFTVDYLSMNSQQLISTVLIPIYVLYILLTLIQRGISEPLCALKAWSLLSYLVFWVPGLGFVHHGWSTLGGDRYNYFPIAFLTPLFVVSNIELMNSHNHQLTSRLWSKAFSFVLLPLSIFGIIFIFSRVSQELLVSWSHDKLALSRCVELDPTNWDCHLYLGNLYAFHDNDKDKANRQILSGIATIKSAISPRLSMLKASTLAQIGNFGEACNVIEASKIELLRRLKAIEPDLQFIGPSQLKLIHPTILPMLLNNIMLCDLSARGLAKEGMSIVYSYAMETMEQSYDWEKISIQYAFIKRSLRHWNSTIESIRKAIESPHPVHSIEAEFVF